MWLGVRTVLAARREAMPDLAGVAAAAGAVPAGVHRAFREGVLVEALNPKTAVFFLAFLPQFVDPASGSAALQFAVLGAVSVALNTLADVAVAVAAGSLRAGASAHPLLVRRLRQGSGAAMIALGLGLALARRPVS